MDDWAETTAEDGRKIWRKKMPGGLEAAAAKSPSGVWVWNARVTGRETSLKKSKAAAEETARRLAGLPPRRDE